jgi:cell division protein FtsA
MFKTKTAVTRALGIGTRSVHLGPRKTNRIAMTHSENDAEMNGRTNRSLKRREIIPRMRPLEADRTKLVAAVDIGTSKTTCLIAQLKPRPVGEALPRRTHAIKIMGVGHVNSCGMKAGAVFNFKQIEQAVRLAIDPAESRGLVVQSALLSVSGGRIRSETFPGSVDMAGMVSDEDITRVLAAARPNPVGAGRATLHCLPDSYSVGATQGIRDPRMMLARRLSVEMHVVSIDGTVARDLMLALESCHVNVETMVASPYAAGLSVLTDDETELGVAVIDLGAGTTTVAVFLDGALLHADGFTLGGHHITMDLARGIGAQIGDAERIKVSYGIAPSGGMETMPHLGEDGSKSSKVVLQSAVTRIVKPRIEEILEMVRDRLAASSFATLPRGHVVLTGGASQLRGLPELAARILGCPVRIGRPIGIAGLTNELKGPAFAVATGLLVYPQVAHLEDLEHFTRKRRPLLAGGQSGYFTQVAEWLRDGFL